MINIKDIIDFDELIVYKFDNESNSFILKYNENLGILTQNEMVKIVFSLTENKIPYMIGIDNQIKILDS